MDDRTGDKLSAEAYQSLVIQATIQISNLVRPGGVVFWVCPADYGWMERHLNVRIGPALYGAPIIWRESLAQYQQKRLTCDYRLIYCHQKPGPAATFNPDAIRVPSVRQQMGDKRADPRGRVPGMVWDIRRLQGTAKEAVGWHPNQMPPELLDRIVLGWSNPGDLVVDGFAGTGSMGLACQRHDRRFVGIDKSPTYVAKMKERLGE